MFNTIRGRLFASYLVVLLIALGILSGVLFTLLKSREVPPEYTWSRLELRLSGFISSDFLRTVGDIANGDETLHAIADDFAETNDIRVLIFGMNQNQAVVLYDSAGNFELRQDVQYNLGEPAPPPQERRHIPGLIVGYFQDTDDSEWLFTGVVSGCNG